MQSVSHAQCDNNQQYIIRGEPERAPDTRETGSGVYYLFVCDLAQQRFNVHAAR